MGRICPIATEKCPENQLLLDWGTLAADLPLVGVEDREIWAVGLVNVSTLIGVFFPDRRMS